MKRSRSMLPVAVVLAIGIRIALIILSGRFGPPDVFRLPDSLTYLAPAHSIVTDGTFLDYLGKPDVFRTPGYPLLLAPLVAVNAPDAWIVAMNIVFAALIVIVTWRIARQLFGDEHAAGICALLVAIEPTML